jgi:hypothetical protein
MDDGAILHQIRRFMTRQGRHWLYLAFIGSLPFVLKEAKFIESNT